MTALALGEIGLDVLFPLRFLEIFLDGGIGTQLERMSPGSDRLFGAVRSLLRVAENCGGIGRAGGSAHRALGIGKCLRRVSDAHQQGRKVNKNGGIVRLETQSTFEIAAGLV